MFFILYLEKAKVSDSNNLHPFVMCFRRSTARRHEIEISVNNVQHNWKDCEVMSVICKVLNILWYAVIDVGV
jgi:hypothetical protein